MGENKIVVEYFLAILHSVSTCLKALVIIITGGFSPKTFRMDSIIFLLLNCDKNLLSLPLHKTAEMIFSKIVCFEANSIPVRFKLGIYILLCELPLYKTSKLNLLISDLIGINFCELIYHLLYKHNCWV
jgi:hypothetical protein